MLASRLRGLRAAVLGLASAWLREQGLRAALGTAVLAGIQLAYAFLGSRGAA